jgi:putative ABC transport system permease protein
MLRMEGIGYALISVIVSLIVGIPLSYVVFSNMNTYRVSFSVPWISDTILFVIIIVLCMISPVVIYQKTQNVSIIERLRNC